MNYIERLEFWGERHHPKYLDLFRIGLGIFLLIKGIDFAKNQAEITNLVSGQVPFGTFMLLIMVHYVIFAHVFGGFLIAIGLLTRIACVIQIPVLMGAIVFVNWNMMDYFSGILLPLIVLAAVVYFFIIGSGPWSVDKAIEDKRLR